MPSCTNSVSAENYWSVFSGIGLSEGEKYPLSVYRSKQSRTVATCADCPYHSTS